MGFELFGQQPSSESYHQTPQLGNQVSRLFSDAPPQRDFDQLHAISQTAGLYDWMGEHGPSHVNWADDSKLRKVYEAIEEGFITPSPQEVIATWRQNSGYGYGDPMPKLSVAIEVTALDDIGSSGKNLRFTGSRSASEFPDSGIRFLYATPQNSGGIGSKNPQDSTSDRPTLSLPVRVSPLSFDEKLKFDITKLRFHVGHEVGISNVVTMSTRASQELVIVATRAGMLAAGKSIDELPPPLPYAKKLKQIGGFASKFLGRR